MIKADDAIRVARSLIGTPYSELDCINLIKRVIHTAPGGVTSYTTAGTNSLWKSYDMSAKYRDLTWRQEGIQGAQAGMLAFKRSGEDVHHVGLVTGDGTVIHSSSARGQVVETELDGSWALLGIHRYIEAAGAAGTEENVNVLYQAVVSTQSGALNVRDAPDGGRIGSVPKGTTVDVLAEPAQGWTFVRAGSLMGYVSSAYLTRIEATDAVGIEPGTIAGAVEATTLMREDGTCVTLLGKWRVAED